MKHDSETTKKRKSYKPIAAITIIAAIDEAWLAWAHTHKGNAYPRDFFMEIPAILRRRRLDTFRRPR